VLSSEFGNMSEGTVSRSQSQQHGQPDNCAVPAPTDTQVVVSFDVIVLPSKPVILLLCVVGRILMEGFSAWLCGL